MTRPGALRAWFDRRPIRVRLVLSQAAVSALVLGVLVIALTAYQSSVLRTNERESLELTARVIADRVAADPAALDTILAATTVPGEYGDLEVVGAVLDRGGRVGDAVGLPTDRPVLPAAALADATTLGHWHGALDLPGRDGDDMVIALRLADGRVLVLGQTLAPVEAGVHRSMITLTALTAAALLAVALGGSWVARRALRPVDDLTRRAGQIAVGPDHDPTAPGDRLPVPPADDEISRLAVTLNEMVDRLARSLGRERRFAADVSHELRTPLGVIALEVELALRSPDTPPDLVPRLRSLQTEIVGLTALIDDLLQLARFETSTDRPARSPQDLREVCAEAIVRAGPASREHGVEVVLDGGSVHALADRLLLRQAVGNLVHNAVGHSPAGSTVVVAVSRDDAVARIAVRDHGPGVPASYRESIFDRHFRGEGDPDRHRARTGLGLEITRRVVEAHGGTVVVDDAPGGGSLFTVELPTDAPAAT